MSESTEAVLESIEAGRIRPLYLVTGDRVLAEPAAIQIGQALGQRDLGSPTGRRRQLAV